MRRTKLGELSASQLTARPALGGSRLGEASKGAPLPPPAPRAERSAGDLGASAAAGSTFGARASLRRTSVFSGSGSALRQVRASLVAPCVVPRPHASARPGARGRTRGL